MLSPQTLVSVYGAVLDDSLWQPALDQLAGDLDAASALIIHSEVQDNIPFRINLGSQVWADIEPEQIEFFEREYGHYEAEAWAYLQQAAAGTIAYDTDFLAAAELSERPDYQYSVENFGLRHRIGVRLNGNRAWFDALTFQYPSDLSAAPESARVLLPQIAPHVAKATECGRMFRTLRNRYQAALAALDHVAIGLCVVTSRAEVVVQNQTASEILSNSSGLQRRSDGVLYCQSNADLFAEAVRRCASTAAGSSGATEVLLATNAKNEGANLLLEVSPLNDQSGEIDKGLSAALVTIIDPTKTESLDTSRVALAWELSDAEAAVLHMLVRGDTNGEMADKRNVSVETVKSQVRSVYNKTGAHKRSGLIRLVARTSPPIR